VYRGVSVRCRLQRRLLPPSSHIVFALSFNYFDRLVLKNVVNKENRRAVAGRALLRMFYLRLRHAHSGRVTRFMQAHVSFWLSRLATIFLSARKFFTLQQAQVTTTRSASAKSATLKSSKASPFMKLYEIYYTLPLNFVFLALSLLERLWLIPACLPSGSSNLPPVQ
jgi:hypothetical protein